MNRETIRDCLVCSKELEWNFKIKKYFCSNCGYKVED